jgi:hypothetical protein
MFTEMISSGIEVTPREGPYVTIGFGVVLLVLCLLQILGILLQARKQPTPVGA